MGDTGLFGDLGFIAEYYRRDLVLIPIGGHFVTDPKDAAHAVAERLGEPGAVLLIRHALAPGIGDPDGFRLDDCATQRNLGEEGRLERIGTLAFGVAGE